MPSAHTDGIVLSGFVERVGDPVPLVAPGRVVASRRPATGRRPAGDGLHHGGQPSPQTAIAVPAHWGTSTLWALRNAMRADPSLAPNGMPARLISDAVASLTALHDNPGLSPHGVVALLDFGGSGTSITLADAASAFEPIEDTTRYTEFSGDLIDQALLNHVLDGIANAGGIDPAGTAAVGSLTRLREECRNAKERLSAETVTELIAELPGYRSGIRVTRTELESLIAQPLDGVFTALENALERNRISWTNVSAVVTIGGGASIPLITSAAFRALAGAGHDDTSARAGRRRGRRVVRRLRRGGRRENRGGAGAAGGCSRSGDAPGSATFRALAWSQDDDTADDVVPYTGDLYDTGGTAARPQVQYVPPTEPIEEPRTTWHRLPQLVFGIAAVVAVVAVGGVAVALTSATDSTKATEPPQHRHVGSRTHQRGTAAVEPRRLSRPSRSPASRQRLRRRQHPRRRSHRRRRRTSPRRRRPRPPQQQPQRRRQQRPPQQPLRQRRRQPPPPRPRRRHR